jgi:heme/copper-type cytochrome/quinol oxidase subunit 2
VIDQRNLRFAPNVLAIPVGTTVEFRNSDDILHNVFSPPRRGDDFDLGTYPLNESRTHTFDETGSFVVLCHVHPEMAAWIVVSESPYVTATDEEGRFRIDSLPAGRYRRVAWYRRRMVAEDTVTIRAERAPVTIALGR